MYYVLVIWGNIVFLYCYICGNITKTPSKIAKQNYDNIYVVIDLKVVASNNVTIFMAGVNNIKNLRICHWKMLINWALLWVLKVITVVTALVMSAYFEGGLGF